MSAFAFVCAVSPALLFTSPLSDAEVIKRMAELDRAFIPARIYAHEQYDEMLGAALVALEGAWNEVSEDLARDQTNPNIVAAFASAQRGIHQAVKYAADGSSPDVIGSMLNAAWSDLRHARGLLGIDYYIDRIEDYRAARADIERRLLDATPESLDRAQLRALASRARLADALWARVTAARFDKILYGLDYYTMGEFAMHRDLQTDAEKAFQQALDSRDPQRILDAAEGLEPNIEAFYRLFGDFE